MKQVPEDRGTVTGDHHAKTLSNSEKPNLHRLRTEVVFIDIITNMSFMPRLS